LARDQDLRVLGLKMMKIETCGVWSSKNLKYTRVGAGFLSWKEMKRMEEDWVGRWWFRRGRFRKSSQETQRGLCS